MHSGIRKILTICSFILLTLTSSAQTTEPLPADTADHSFVGAVTNWYSNHMNLGGVTLLMTIESSFIPFPSEVIIPPAVYVAEESSSSLNITDSYLLNVLIIVLFATLGALLGAIINYLLSMWLGRPIIYKFADSRLGHLLLLSSEKIQKAEDYFNERGKVSTFVGRLIPAIRQLISIPAGLARMPFGAFIGYTTLGALTWNIVLALLGYIAHGQKDLIDQYSHELSIAILAIVGVVILIWGIKKLITIKKNNTMRNIILLACLIFAFHLYASETSTIMRTNNPMPWHSGYLTQSKNTKPTVNISKVPQARKDTVIESDSTISEGRDFWVTFMTQYTDYDESFESKVIISSSQLAHVTIENPNRGWSKNVTVPAMGLEEINIPLEHCLQTSHDVISDKAIHIISDVPIAVFATNFADFSFDATNILPTTVLETQYILQTYDGFLESGIDTLGKSDPSAFFMVTDTLDELLFSYNFISPAEAAVVATEDNTTLTITPSALTLDNHAAGVPYKIQLNRGEVYQIFSFDDSRLSGTRVNSNKKIAVYNGNTCNNVPKDVKACDHLVEQAIPVSMWGTRFVVTSSYGLVSDQIVITASADNTDIYIDNNLVTTINALESYEFRLVSSTRAAYIFTSEPVGCNLYISGGQINNELSDPSMVWISPIEQRIRQVTFGTFETTNTQSHYVNIVTPTMAVGGMTLDGNNISSYFSQVSSNAELSYARIEISHATHILNNNIDGFVAHVYGTGLYESYAYNTGSSVRHLSHQTTAEITWDIQTSCSSDKYGSLTYNIMEGVDRIRLTHIDENLYDTTFRTVVPSSKTISIFLPRHGNNKYVAYCYFEGILMRVDTLNAYNYFPASVLLQKWDDFIGVQTPAYNGGYDFTDFQWYKNGEQLAGETKSYLYTPLEFGAQYYALLTDTHGDQAFTCQLTATPKEQLTIYPTITTAARNIRVKTSTITQVAIYRTTGLHVSTHIVAPENDTFVAPNEAGMYLVRLTTDDNQTRVVEMIVR